MLALVKRLVIVTVSTVLVAFNVLIVANALSQQKPSSGRHCITVVSSPSISQSYSYILRRMIELSFIGFKGAIDAQCPAWNPFNRPVA